MVMHRTLRSSEHPEPVPRIYCRSRESYDRHESVTPFSATRLTPQPRWKHGGSCSSPLDTGVGELLDK